MKHLFILCLAFFLSIYAACAQNITGTIMDSKTGEPLPFGNVRYEGTTTGTSAGIDGRFTIKKIIGRHLVVSYTGYEKQSIAIVPSSSYYDIRLKALATDLREAKVTSRRKKYVRKDNPAIAFMRKVIAAKKSVNFKSFPYFSYNQYRKTTVAIDGFSEKVFKENENGKPKSTAFLKDFVETNPETGRLTLPVSVHEQTSHYIYRKDPQAEKNIITAKREVGINKLINTGDIIDVTIEDCFTDVNLFDDNIRLLQYPFISPISSHNAIAFYHYFLSDTTLVKGQRCVEVEFAPANSQDFGFSGYLYVLADSSYRVVRAILNIPKRSDVNYVENLEVLQEFDNLPTGEPVLITDKMIAHLSLGKKLTKFQVTRHTHYKDYSMEEIPAKDFKVRMSEIMEPDALVREDTYWDKQRPEKLSHTEENMDDMLKGFQNMKHFKIGMLVVKAFIENFVETSTNPARPSKFDFGPINTSITQNFIDGLRLRLSGQTTANLSRHLFGKGYLAYGFRDERWKGLAECTYAFNPKAYLPREFPTNNLTVSYQSDVMSPSDKFLPTDKDNVFTSFKWTKVDQMMYFNRLRLRYEREFYNGLRIEAEAISERSEATGQLIFQPLDGNGAPAPASHIPSDNKCRFLNTSQLRLGAYFQPHAKYVNTKQRRLTINRDSPCFSLYHTFGFKNILGGDYSYNLTEASIYKRFWIPGAGKIDTKIQCGAQWNSVPWPLLIMPAANLSFIKEDDTFNLINNMEFLNDRYASLMVSWDLNGRFFNRIPLLRKLKWREFISCNVLWGSLTDKNNPWKHPDDSRLYYFPGHFDATGNYTYSSYVMDSKTPYVEVTAGIHNIFKLVHIEAVRRLTYLDLPTAHKWGVRFMVRMTF